MMRYKTTAERIHASQVMSKRLVCVRGTDTLRHAAGVMLDKRISGVPVLDAQGRAVGVLTKTDIARFEREHLASRAQGPAPEAMRALGTLELVAGVEGFHAESDEDRVAAWMTPKVFSLEETASLGDVLREMQRRRIHRLFIRQRRTGCLTGVVTTFDLMRFLGQALSVRPGP